jgi:uncharacterized phiE125 gp8 family phage protein
MSLTIVTAATSYNLTSVSAVRSQLGLTDNSEGENLARWISQASDTISKFCNRVFAEETVAETFRLKCREEGLLLKRFPVSAIVSVVENDITLTATDYELANEGDGGVLNRLRSDRECEWPIGKIVVTYTAGYALPTDLPDGIERAAIMLVSQYRNTSDRDPQIRSEAIEGAGSTSYFDGLETQSGLAPEVIGLISKHRKPSGG